MLAFPYFSLGAFEMDVQIGDDVQITGPTTRGSPRFVGEFGIVAALPAPNEGREDVYYVRIIGAVRHSPLDASFPGTSISPRL